MLPNQSYSIRAKQKLKADKELERGTQVSINGLLLAVAAQAEGNVRAPNNSIIGILIFLLVLGASLAVFAWRVKPLVQAIAQGKPENRLDNIPRRASFLLTGWLFQKKMFRRLVPGLAHAFLFWGFLIVNIGVVYSIFHGMFPVDLPILSSRPVAIMVDLFIAIVLITIVYFAIRRAFLKPKYLTITKDGWIVLTLISTGLIFELLIEAFAWRAVPKPENGYYPIGRRLGELLIPASANWPSPSEPPEAVRDTAQMLWTVFWWAKVATVAFFFTYLPTSKHFHVITSAIATFFQSTRPKGELKKVENIEDLEHYGANKVEDFTWHDLLDTTTCTECGRCTAVCPANQTGKPLNPKKIIIDLKQHVFAQSKIPLTGHGVGLGGTTNDDGKGIDYTVPIPTQWKIEDGAADSGTPPGATAPTPLPSLVGEMITHDELWACTTCRACMTECPVFIEHVPKIVDMRRYLVMEESEFPKEVQPLFTNLERNGNPWQIRPDERLEWVSKLEFEPRVLAELDEGDEVDILFWTGCMGALDQRNKKVIQNLATILEEAKLNWAILGPEESCTGDPARRAGNEYLFQMLAEQNVETLNDYKAKHKIKKIVTACPHCFNSLANDYPAFGLHFEVVHHTKLLAKLIEEGKIQAGDGLEGKKITYHDPCYLGRYNDIYDAPRFVLNSLGTGLKKAEVVEMPRNKSKSFCCGGGGGRMWMEEKIGTRVNQTRIQEAADTGAEIVAASCPFCVSMFEDGIKGKGLEDKLKVIEVTELLQMSRQQKQITVGAEAASPSDE
jgi:Fe-S oxidoreductase